MTACLLADIGGTRARFALSDGARIGPIESMMTGEYASAADAIRHFLHRQSGAGEVDRAVIAVAGPVSGGRSVLTNASWVLETTELKRVFGFDEVDIVNDLVALAWAIPRLGPLDLQAIGGGTEVAAEPVAVIAPGTGLGMACFVPCDDRPSVLSSEGGHATLPAATAVETEIVEALGRRYGHVSAERVLSGGGLENIYAVLADRQDDGAERLPAPQIVQAAMDGSSPRARRALDAFCGFLGGVAGNVALTFAARGGVLFAGGIVPRIVDHLRASDFRVRFESKGRFARYLAGVSTKVIVRPEPAFLGLQVLAARMVCAPDPPLRQAS